MPSPSPAVDPAVDPAADPAASWVDHLRHGGTETWTRWRDRSAGPPAGSTALVPGAQQLELLRRLNESGRPSAALADRVLAASLPGRGLPDLGLVGADPNRFGPRPVDPAGLPVKELLRVATSLLADDLVAAGPPETGPARRPRRWRTHYRLLGDPVLVRPRREALIASGRPPGGRHPKVLVLGTDLGQMIVDSWTARCFGAGAPSWRASLQPVATGRSLPPRIDLAAVADHWAGRVGRRRVRVVLDPDAVPSLVRVRRPLPTAPVLSADAVELARLVGQVLGVLVVPPLRLSLLRETLVPRLVAHPGPPLILPPELTGEVQARAERMRVALVRSGYPVHGDPAALLPVDRDGVAGPSGAGVLALAMRLLLERGSR